MPLAVTHWTESTTKAERAAMREEQAQWRAMEARIAELEAALVSARSAALEEAAMEFEPEDGNSIVWPDCDVQDVIRALKYPPSSGCCGSENRSGPDLMPTETNKP